MSKIELNTSIADYGWSQINANFQEIEDELNQKVLYRDNPVGEPNSMNNTNLDMNGNSIVNAQNVSAQDITIKGTSLEAQVDIATDAATSASASASAASSSASSASSSASSAATSASNAAATLANALTKANNLSDVQSASTSRTNLGLGNVDNTSDANKPVSTAQQAALDLKAPLASPTFTGDPKAPTPAPGDNDTSIATTAFVTTAVANAAAGRLIAVRVISTTQTYTPTAGTNSIVAYLVGGGGGGGGAAAPGGGQASTGSGGGAGGTAVSRFTSGFSGQTITIGAAGTGSSAAAGTQGGASTFNGLTANGGIGGLIQTATASLVAFGGGAGGTASGGNLYNTTGAPGGNAIQVGSAAGQSVGGNGASSLFGNGGVGVTSNSGTAATATGFGAGGAGASASSGAGPYAGGNGTAGVAVIYEYS